MVPAGDPKGNHGAANQRELIGCARVQSLVNPPELHSANRTAAQHAAEPDVAGRCIDRFGNSRGEPEALAVVDGTQVPSAFQDLAADPTGHHSCRRVGAELRVQEAEFPAGVAILRLILFTGSRRGEIEGLRWD